MSNEAGFVDGFDMSRYEVVYTSAKGVNVYGLRNITELHMKRYIAARTHDMYSSAGVSVEVLRDIVEDGLRRCNDEKNVSTLRTDLTLLLSSLSYRMEYPIDQRSLLRMGCVLTLLPGEPENDLLDFWMEKKLALADSDPGAYAFFLGMGVAHSAEYESHLVTLKDAEFFQKRQETIRSLLPKGSKGTLAI